MFQVPFRYVANCDHVMTDKPQLIAMYSQYISSLYVATTSDHRQNLQGIIPNSQYYTILLGTCKEVYRPVKAGNHDLHNRREGQKLGWYNYTVLPSRFLLGLSKLNYFKINPLVFSDILAT